MKNLIIIGARNLGRETFSLAKTCAEHSRDFKIKGFLDDKNSALDGFNYPIKVISSVESYSIQNGDVFICALAEGKYKEIYSNMILEQGGEFISLIHPGTEISENVSIGAGAIVQNSCILGNDIQIKDFVTVQSFSAIGHDSIVEDYVHISAYSFLGGGVHMAKGSFTGVRATILPNIKVGINSKVGACSLAVKNVPEGSTVFGVPAVRL